MEGLVNLILFACIIGGIYFFARTYIDYKKKGKGGGAKSDGQERR